MKKLLIVGLSVAMGTALALGITACGKKGNSDADTAKEAIKTVTNLHASVGTETPTSYKVTGATRVGTQVVTVEWSVTSTYEGYADYVSVGEKGADQQVAINITQHEEDAIDYTLTASVTVGKATETKDFSHTIPAGGKIYTPSEAKTLAGTLDADAYYMEEGVVTAINVKGYVVAIEGGWNTQYNELQKVYIGDTAETAKTDALYVYYIDSDPVYMTKEFDVEVGDLITVRGALQNYKGNTPELTYNGTGESRIDPVIVAPIQKAPKTDAQILDDAKNALKINEYYSATGDYDLPVPIKDVTATWALEGGNNEYVKVEDGKLTVLKLPDSETSYKLTATLSYGTATPVKAEFTIKLGKLALTHAGTEADPFTPAEALTIAATLADKQYYSDTNGVKAVYVKGKVVDVGTWSGGKFNNYNKVYIIAEDAYTANATKDTTGAILVYRIASDPQLTEGTLKHGDTLLLLCGIQRYGETYELGSTKGSSDTTNSATLVTYTSGGGSVTPGPDEPDPDTNYGTKEEPLSVAEALALGKDLAKNEVLGGTTPQVVYVTGYVVEVGTFNRTYNNFNSFYIADSQDGTKATGLCVYGLNLNAEGTFTRKGDLVKGAQITLYGALKGYEPSTGTLYPELTFSGSVKVYASSYTDPRTDAEKAQAAVTAVEFESMDLTGDIELPKPTVTGVTFAWVSDNQAATVDSATNKLTVTRGDADQNVKLTLTATCGTQGTATEDYNFVVKQKLNLTPGEQNFTIDFSTNFTTYTDSSEWKDSSNRYGVYGEHTLSFATLGVSTVEGTVELNNASRQNSTITTLPTLAAKNTLTAYVTVHAEGVSIQSLTFNLQEWTNKKKFSKIVIETSTNGSTWTEYGTAVGDGTSNTLLISENDTFTFTATDDTVTYVRLAIYATGTSNVQVGIKSIEMKVKTLSATVAAPAQVAILPGKEF